MTKTFTVGLILYHVNEKQRLMQYSFSLQIFAVIEEPCKEPFK